MSTCRIVFMGTPAFAVPPLEALLASPYQVVGVFTQPDRPVGRGQQLAAPPVKQRALAHGLPVFQPAKLRGNDEALAKLKEWAPDCIVVVAYGQILPVPVLDLPPFRCLNVHASLLPAYRGAAPIAWSLIHGERETGVTTMLMEQGLDTGPILQMARTPIDPDETAETLSARLSLMGADLLLQTLAGWFAGTLTPLPQDDGKASYAPMLRKDLAVLDWTQTAHQLHDRVRGQQPWPGASSTIGKESFKLLRTRVLAKDTVAPPGTLLALTPEGWEIATGAGVLRIEAVQLPGRKIQEAGIAARGWRGLCEGVMLGGEASALAD